MIPITMRMRTTRQVVASLLRSRCRLQTALRSSPLTTTTSSSSSSTTTTSSTTSSTSSTGTMGPLSVSAPLTLATTPPELKLDSIIESNSFRVSSSIGSDVSMISSNHRHRHTTTATQRRSFSQMKDEYGAMDDSGSTYEYQGAYTLESGQILQNPELRYQTYGTLNDKCDNVVVVCHALTGNASLHAWWGDLLGPGRAFDTNKYLVVCCNILGSCYGSTSPVSIDPVTNKEYGVDFPDVSVKDTVRLQLLLLQNELNVTSVKAVVGGSFGGMQAVEFAVQAGSATAEFTQTTDADNNGTAAAPFVRSVIPIACGAQHTAWQIAVSHVQRQAIYYDPNWIAGNYAKATNGLEIARQLGMVSYRTPTGYSSKFGRKLQQLPSGSAGGDDDSPPYGSKAAWQVKSYLEYQGAKFLGRFDPVTYVKMTEQMDSHDVARGRGDSAAAVLQGVDIPALVLGIDSDVLYPLAEQRELADALPQGHLEVIHSDNGHDGFLLEQEQVAAHIIKFLNQHE